MRATNAAAVAMALALTAWAAPAAAQTAKADAKTVARGQDVYKQQKCQLCHSIDGVGNKKAPLDDVGARLKEEEIRKWITAPREMDPKARKKAYKLPAEDLDALVAYLQMQQKKQP